MSILNRKLYRDLWHMRGPVLAIALVMACGVATAVLMFGTMTSLRETRDAYYERYRFAHVFGSLKRAPEGLVRDIARIPGVARAQSRILRDVILDVQGMSEPARGRLISIPESGEPTLNNLVIRQGRWIRKGKPNEVIISENFADAHGFEPGDQVTALVNGHKRALHIVGTALSPEFIYAVSPGQLMPDDKTFGIIWMGREALEAAFDLKGAFNDVTLALLRNASEVDVIDRLDRLLEPYGGVGAIGRNDQISHAFISNELEQLDLFGRIIPPLFLGVAAFLLHIVISRLVDREREEIGLLKAFGYSDMEVGWHYLKFVLVLAMFGILVGVICGLWMGRGLTELYTQFFRFPFLYYRLDLGVFVIASLISLAAAVIGALQAVRKAVQLNPAVAMRSAPPVDYKRTLIERLGFSHWVSESTRMILRHIERWPARAGLTTLGISFSVALLISTLFPLQSIEHVIDVFYFQSQRQDATISFIEARNAFSSQSVLNLPGVMVAERFRSVPAKISFRHRDERVSIVGLDHNADLNRLLDVNLNPISAPPEGLVLSTYLAREIGAGIGDLVQVDVMTGKRPKADLPVTAIIEEYIGVAAYMDISALNRLMKEGPAVSGFHVKLDEQRADDLYREIKNTPIIAGISLKSTVLRSFKETIEETMDIAFNFYLLFAGAIAFGVVYNSARIAYSERAREMASLRVLGFTKGEVGFILLGELVVLTLAALPIGCVLGYLLAWVMAMGFETDIIRIPIYITLGTYATSMIVVMISAIISAFAVAWKINKLDLVAVLKTRE